MCCVGISTNGVALQSDTHVSCVPICDHVALRARIVRIYFRLFSFIQSHHQRRETKISALLLCKSSFFLDHLSATKDALNYQQTDSATNIPLESMNGHYRYLPTPPRSSESHGSAIAPSGRSSFRQAAGSSYLHPSRVLHVLNIQE